MVSITPIRPRLAMILISALADRSGLDICCLFVRTTGLQRTTTVRTDLSVDHPHRFSQQALRTHTRRNIYACSMLWG